MGRDSGRRPGLAPPLVLREPFNVTWRERMVVLGVAGGGLVIALVLGMIYSHEATVELLGLVPASIFVIGKFLPLVPLSGQSAFSPWELGFTIWILDTYTVLIVVYGTEALYGIRPVKRALERVQTNASLVLAAYPRIRRAATFGVVMFVLFPIAGTGALVGAFLGILLGLHRGVLIAAVSLGGLIGGMLMAFAAVNFGEGVQQLRAMQSSPVVKYAMIASVVIVIVAAFWWLSRAYKRALALAEAHAADLDDSPPDQAASSDAARSETSP